MKLMVKKLIIAIIPFLVMLGITLASANGSEFPGGNEINAPRSGWGWRR